MAELAANYEQLYGTRILLEGGGDREGFRRISDNSAHIGGACRPKNTNDVLEKNAQANPVAWDALVVMVHPNNPVSNITVAQVRDLYLGRITNWKQLGGENQPLKLFVRQGKDSGVGRSIRKYFFKNYDQEFTAHQAFPSSAPLEKAIESDPHAIGISGIASVQKRNVKALKLEGIRATADNIQNGSYLLYRPLHIIFNPDNPRYREIKQFLKFAHSAKGREIIRKQGVIPYLEAKKLVEKEREHWAVENPIKQ